MGLKVFNTYKIMRVNYFIQISSYRNILKLVYFNLTLFIKGLFNVDVIYTDI